MKASLYAIIATIIPLSAAAAVVQGSQDIQQLLNAAGYADVREIEFSDGLWEAEARTANARWQEVYIEPSSGAILRPTDSSLPLAEIAARLEAAGYRQIHDLERDGGIWEAEATNASGERVELRLASTDGRILHSEVDHNEMGQDD